MLLTGDPRLGVDELAIELEEYRARTRGMVGCSLPMQFKLDDPIEARIEVSGGGHAGKVSASKETKHLKQKRHGRGSDITNHDN